MMFTILIINDSFIWIFIYIYIFAFLKLRGRLRLNECRKAFWGGIGERISKMVSMVVTTNQDLEDITLEANDIPGAELPKPPELCTVAILKRWLSCRGAKVSGKRHELIKRLVVVSTIKHATYVICT